MQKDEILERSRNERKDEGMENAENRGRKIGFIIFVCLFIALTLFNIMRGEFRTQHAISVLFWAFLSAEAYGKYRFAKNKAYLVTAIAGGIASLASLANYIMTVLGVIQ